MKILEILNEDRNEQQRRANALRALYRERDDVKQMLNKVLVDGDEDAAHDLQQELDAVEIEIEQLEKGINESIDHKEMLRGLQKALTKAQSDLAEMEADLRSMNNAARTEEEHDAVNDFRTRVEKKRGLVERLTKRVKLRKAALGGAV